MVRYQKIFLGILGIVVLASFINWFLGKEINLDVKKSESTKKNEIKKAEFEKLFITGEELGPYLLNELENYSGKLEKNDCTGILYDQNEDNIYEKKFLGKGVQYKSDIVVKYNYCSYIWKKDKIFSMIITSKKLMDDFNRTEGDLYYFPVLVYKLKENGELFSKEIGMVDSRELN